MLIQTLCSCFLHSQYVSKLIFSFLNNFLFNLISSTVNLPTVLNFDSVFLHDLSLYAYVPLQYILHRDVREIFGYLNLTMSFFV